MDILGFNDSMLFHILPRAIIVAIIVIALFCIFFRWLWNTTMPQIFGLKEITLGQSLKILLMAWILFGHFGSN